MNKKRSLVLKLAAFLVAIVPIVPSGKFFAGEPKLPAKMDHEA